MCSPPPMVLGTICSLRKQTSPELVRIHTLALSFRRLESGVGLCLEAFAVVGEGVHTLHMRPPHSPRDDDRSLLLRYPSTGGAWARPGPSTFFTN